MNFISYKSLFAIAFSCAILSGNCFGMFGGSAYSMKPTRKETSEIIYHQATTFICDFKKQCQDVIADTIPNEEKKQSIESLSIFYTTEFKELLEQFNFLGIVETEKFKTPFLIKINNSKNEILAQLKQKHVTSPADFE